MNCPTAADSLIDCGNDDYFNPSGQVLGIDGLPLWNVYESAFLCAASGCGTGAPGPRISSTPAAPAPAPAPATPAPTPAPVKPRPATTTPRDPLADLAKLWQPQVRRLLAGRGLRMAYRPRQSGTFTAKLVLGGRAIAAASARARANQRVVVTLRLSKASRRKLARSAANLKLRLVFVH
jgi:pyruvate/2-oxoglutarate dehydrogenase complex dihydrolipoamide acyltransferase (E2) component